MKFVFYGDETGIHAGGSDASKVTMIAGYIASVEKWKLFDIAWNKLLENYCVRKVHAIELAKSKESFRNWKALAKQKFLIDAVSVIGAHDLLGISSHFNNADYDRIYKGGVRPTKTRIYSRYGIATAGLIATLVPLTHRPEVPLESLDLVLADGAPGHGDAVHVFNWMKADNELSTKKLGLLTFVADTNTPGLQAADLFAYAAYQHLRNRGPIARFQTMWDGYLSVRPPAHHYAFMSSKVLRNLKDEALRLESVRMEFGRSVKQF